MQHKNAWATAISFNYSPMLMFWNITVGILPFVYKAKWPKFEGFHHRLTYKPMSMMSSLWLLIADKPAMVISSKY